MNQVMTAVTAMQSASVRSTTEDPRRKGMSVTLKRRTGGNTALRVTSAIFHFGGGVAGRPGESNHARKPNARLTSVCGANLSAYWDQS